MLDDIKAPDVSEAIEGWRILSIQEDADNGNYLTGAYGGEWRGPYLESDEPPSTTNQNGIYITPSPPPSWEVNSYSHVVCWVKGWGTYARHQRGWRCEKVEIQEMWTTPAVQTRLPTWTKELEVHIGIPAREQTGFDLAIGTLAEIWEKHGPRPAVVGYDINEDYVRLLVESGYLRQHAATSLSSSPSFTITVAGMKMIGEWPE